MYRSSSVVRRRVFALSLHVAVIIAFIGCGKSLPVATEPEKKDARDALIAVLDAWQQGKLSSLGSLSPPLALRDDDVVSGHALVSYEFDPALEVKPHTDVQVNLILRDPAGKTHHRTATYQVSLAPTRTVLRNDP